MHNVYYLQTKYTQSVLNIHVNLILSPSDIKKIRKELSLKQIDFAEKVGVSISTVRSWEGGTRNISNSASKVLLKIRDEYIQGKSSSISEDHIDNTLDTELLKLAHDATENFEELLKVGSFFTKVKGYTLAKIIAFIKMSPEEFLEAEKKWTKDNP